MLTHGHIAYQQPLVDPSFRDVERIRSNAEPISVVEGTIGAKDDPSAVP